MDEAKQGEGKQGEVLTVNVCPACARHTREMDLITPDVNGGHWWEEKLRCPCGWCGTWAEMDLVERKNDPPAPPAADWSKLDVVEGKVIPILRHLFDLCEALGLPMMTCVQYGDGQVAGSYTLPKWADDRLHMAQAAIDGRLSVEIVGIPVAPPAAPDGGAEGGKAH